MSYWTYERIGVAVEEKYLELAKALMECCGISFQTRGDFDDTYWVQYDEGPSESILGWPMLAGDPRGTRVSVEELFPILNKVFGWADVYFAQEQASSVSDSYFRAEWLLLSREKQVRQACCQYCEGDCTVGSEQINAFRALKDQIESAAKIQRIPIAWDSEGDSDWDPLFPDEDYDEFSDLAYSILNSRIKDVATKIHDEPLPDLPLKEEILAAIFKEAKSANLVHLYLFMKDALNKKMSPEEKEELHRLNTTPKPRQQYTVETLPVAEEVVRMIGHVQGDPIINGSKFVISDVSASEATLTRLITERGGEVKSSTVLDTTYIIIGNQSAGDTFKIRRALELNLTRGKNIRAILELEFWEFMAKQMSKEALIRILDENEYIICLGKIVNDIEAEERKALPPVKPFKLSEVQDDDLFPNIDPDHIYLLRAETDCDDEDRNDEDFDDEDYDDEDFYDEDFDDEDFDDEDFDDEDFDDEDYDDEDLDDEDFDDANDAFLNSLDQLQSTLSATIDTLNAAVEKSGTSKIQGTNFDLFSWTFTEGKVFKGTDWSVPIPDGFKILPGEDQSHPLLAIPEDCAEDEKVPRVKIIGGFECSPFLDEEEWFCHRLALQGMGAIIGTNTAEKAQGATYLSQRIIPFGFEDRFGYINRAKRTLVYQENICTLTNPHTTRIIRVNVAYATDEQDAALENSLRALISKVQLPGNVPKRSPKFCSEALIQELLAGKTSGLEAAVKEANENYLTATNGSISLAQYHIDNDLCEDREGTARKLMKEGMEIAQYFYTSANEMVERLKSAKASRTIMQQVYRKLKDLREAATEIGVDDGIVRIERSEILDRILTKWKEDA